MATPNLPAVFNYQVGGPRPYERVILAYRIPYLPEALASTNLAGQNEQERLRETLELYVRLVSGLAGWQGYALSLRYFWRPDRGAVEITIIARGFAAAGQSQMIAASMANNLRSLLSSVNIFIEPITDPQQLHEVLAPAGLNNVFEVRQHEEILNLRMGDAYVVYPFRAPVTNWLQCFTTLVGQQAPCLVNIHLEPTRLYPNEQQDFAASAAVAKSAAQVNYQGVKVSSYQLADPQADVVADLYNDYIQRLTNPFLAVVQVASPDPMTARLIAQSFAAEISENSTVRAAQGPGQLPSGFTLATPANQQDAVAAWQTLTTLELAMWGTTPASPEQHRLRFLMDARTASAAFRFPVAIRGGIPGVTIRQPQAGVNPGARKPVNPATEVRVGAFSDGRGDAVAPISYLTRHTLVVGTTGYGKTTTCMYILQQLWRHQPPIPFLVIEPAKFEYHALLDSPLAKDVRVFTLGDEATAPFRLNPLEVLPGVRVESHIALVRACLEATMPLIAPLPGILQDGVYNVYRRRGWRNDDVATANDTREPPTLGDLYAELIEVVERRNYAGEVRENIRAAVGGRLGSLLRGSKGRMLNTRHSFPMAELMSAPAVLELEPLNADEKALVMLFLLTHIREYCRTTRPDSSLQHMTLIEEAHVLLSKPQSGTNREVEASVGPGAGKMFGDMLSEVRGFGEGIMIADQVPVRLIDDALKNTNTKIVHRLPAEEDRAAIGATMAATDEDELYIGRIAPGQAAFFTGEMERPAFIQAPDWRAEQHIPSRTPDDTVRTQMASVVAARVKSSLPFIGCQHCQRVCQYREDVESVAYEMESALRARTSDEEFAEKYPSDPAGAWHALAASCVSEVRRLGLGRDEHAAYCYFTHTARDPFNAQSAERFRESARAVISGK